jgi:hypothetical protein
MEELIREDALGVLPKRSTSDNRIKQTIGYINSMAKKMGQPTLVPTATSSKGSRKEKRPKVTEEWTLCCTEPAPALFYANVAIPRAPPPVLPGHVDIANPIIYEDRVVDPTSGASYPLAPQPPDMMAVHIVLAAHHNWLGFAGTLAHAACSSAKGAADQHVTCFPVLFHRSRLLHVVFSPALKDTLIFAVTKLFHMEFRTQPHSPPSNVPLPHLPTWCIEPRVRLLPVGPHWTMEDHSVYNFASATRDASATPTE